MQILTTSCTVQSVVYTESIKPINSNNHVFKKLSKVPTFLRPHLLCPHQQLFVYNLRDEVAYDCMGKVSSKSSDQLVEKNFWTINSVLTTRTIQ